MSKRRVIACPLDWAQLRWACAEFYGKSPEASQKQTKKWLANNWKWEQQAKMKGTPQLKWVPGVQGKRAYKGMGNWIPRADQEPPTLFRN